MYNVGITKSLRINFIKLLYRFFTQTRPLPICKICKNYSLKNSYFHMQFSGVEKLSTIFTTTPISMLKNSYPTFRAIWVLNRKHSSVKIQLPHNHSYLSNNNKNKYPFRMKKNSVTKGRLKKMNSPISHEKKTQIHIHIMDIHIKRIQTHIIFSLSF